MVAVNQTLNSRFRIDTRWVLHAGLNTLREECQGVRNTVENNVASCKGTKPHMTLPNVEDAVKKNLVAEFTRVPV